MTKPPLMAFIGGGNMASAILSGLIKRGTKADQLLVVEPFEATRDKLQQDLQIRALPAASPTLTAADLVVWAVKPQQFHAAAKATQAFLSAHCAHLSVMAGIRSDALVNALQNPCVIRAMPNTPALVGLGMTGLYARAEVSPAQKAQAHEVLSATGLLMWLEQESLLDAVTALSGSGPAYVFYFVEAMVAAGEAMGLTAAQAKTLALQTFTGAAELARLSPDSPGTLRERVTSKGGTTFAALTHMDQQQLGRHFIDAMHAAQQRAQALGDEFG